MNISGLSEATIRQQATAQSFSRGQDYYYSGAVLSLVQRENDLYAQVEGSQYEPYSVWVALDDDGIADVFCDCPYDWGGWCKHIVAVSLACLHEPESFEVRPSVEELLAGLDREQLSSLLLHLAAYDSGLVDVIERQVAVLQSDSGDSAPRTTINPAPIRRQVYSILHSLDHMRRSEAYWHVSRIVNQVRQMLKQAQDMVKAGDVRNALVLLEAITDEYIEGWGILDDSDGDVGGFFVELGDAWEEAVLAADLSPAEREEWRRKLVHWQEEISGYELDGVFEIARMALEED